MAQLTQGWRGYAGFGKQTSIGTSVAATKFQTINPNVSMVETRAGRTRIQAIRKTQDFAVATRGRIGTQGSISGPLMPDEAFQGFCLAMLMGNNNAVSTVDTSAYEHVFSQPTPTTTAHYPQAGATMEILPGGSSATTLRDFVGTFAKSMTLKGSMDGGVIDVDFEMVGVRQDDAGTVSTPTYSTKPPFEAWMMDLKIGSDLGSLSSVELIDFSIKIDNGVKMLPALNGRTPVDRSFGDFDAQLDFTMWFREDLTIYNYFKNETEMAVSFVITHDSLAGASSAVYKLKFDFPRVIFDGTPPNLDSMEEIKHKVTMKALKGTGSDAYTVKITSVNTESGTYAV